jgi:hypothetical protein
VAITGWKTAEREPVGTSWGDGPTLTNDISVNTYSIYHKPGHMNWLEVRTQHTDRGY